MREQLNPQRPNASDPSPDTSISLGSLWGGLSRDRIPEASGKMTFPGLGSAAGSRCRRSGRLGAPLANAMGL